MSSQRYVQVEIRGKRGDETIILAWLKLREGEVERVVKFFKSATVERVGDRVVVNTALNFGMPAVTFRSPPTYSLSLTSEVPQLGEKALYLEPVVVKIHQRPHITVPDLAADLPQLPGVAPKLAFVDVVFKEAQRLGPLALNDVVPEIKTAEPHLQPATVSWAEKPSFFLPPPSSDVPQISAPRASTTGVPQASGGDYDIELLSFFEDLYARNPVLRLGSILADRPLVILAERESQDYIEFLKRVLREIYLVRAGSLPTNSKHISNSDDLEKVMPVDVSAGGRIFVFDLRGGRFRIESIRDGILDRLRELYSQRLGFFVFYGSRERLREVKGFWKMGMSDTPRPIEIALAREDIQILNVLADAMWGMPSLSGKPYGDLDEHVVYLEDWFWKELERATGAFDILLRTKPSDDSGSESKMHYLVKAFVVSYLAGKISEELKRTGLDDKTAWERALSCVDTERELGSIRVDVYVECEGPYRDLAVEVETLYGTGTMIHKLREVVESRYGRVNMLWIVIPNPQAVLHLPLLLKFRRWSIERYGRWAELFTLDLEGGGLIRLADLAKRIHDRSIQDGRSPGSLT